MADSVFHPGELEIQRCAGVEQMARRVGGSIRASVPPAAEAFLAQRRWAVLSTADEAGRPWASVLRGEPGFISVVRDAPPGSSLLRIEAEPLAGDPLLENLRSGTPVGLLAIDLATRRRMRVNANLLADGPGALLLRIDQVYSNCHKYIQRRVAEDGDLARSDAPPRRVRTLDPALQGWIASSDTFFIATVNPGEGADASHRGGAPGFVRVDGDRLEWPDYQGNMMFNTLGNLARHPRAGLLFPDFASGRALQLTGRASINWEPAAAALYPGAERLVEVAVEEVVELGGVFPARLNLVDYSPHLPR